jgi:hypothetical protein
MLAQHALHIRSMSVEVVYRVNQKNHHALACRGGKRWFFNSRADSGRKKAGDE